MWFRENLYSSKLYALINIIKRSQYESNMITISTKEIINGRLHLGPVQSLKSS